MKRLSAFALALCLSAPALAGSGSYVTDIKGNASVAPNTILFTMFDDSPVVWYCSSARSPGAAQVILTLNTSKSPLLGLHPSVLFAIGTPSGSVTVDGVSTLVSTIIHSADCQGNVTPV